MATGGSPSKGSSSDSHTRSGWQSTSDDAVSMNSILNELRPNNLEVSEWKDSTLESSKRRKKGNRERERERGQCQSLLQHDVHPSERRQHHTPSTYPRTKLPPNAQIGDKMELENLRRHISFDGFDEVSTDDEKNNDRYMSSSSNRREMSTNHTRSRRQDTSSSPNYQSHQCLTTNSCEQKRIQNNENDTCDESGLENDDDEEEDDDEDEEEEEGDEQLHVNQRSQNNKEDRTREAITDSNQIVARLMQIKDYLKQVKLMMDTLEQSDDPSDHRKVSKLAQVMSSLQEQEKSYMEILQKLWVIRRHAMMNSENYQDEISKPESPEGSDSLDFEENSQISDSSMPNFEPSLVRRGDNVISMQHHQVLLQQIIDQKEQLKLLQQRQEALLTIEKDAVRKLADARDKQKFLEQQTLHSMSSPTSEVEAYGPGNQLTENGLSDDVSDSAKNRQNNLPPTNQLSEEKTSPNELAVANEEINDRFHETISQGRLSLQNKLQHLQEKRKYVDELLNYVKTLHVQHREDLPPMNNDSERTDPSTYGLPNEELAVEKFDPQNQDEMNMGDSSCKWEEIQGMRERLNHLRSLFQQCQNNTEPNVLESKDHSTEKEAKKKAHNANHVKSSSVESYDRFSEPNNIPNQSDIEDDDLAVELGSLMHQPEVQDKFNELREAKERLRHLQDLIGKLNENGGPISVEGAEEFVDTVSQTNGSALVWQSASPSREVEPARGTTLEQEEAQASADQLLPLHSKSTEIKVKMQEQLVEVERLKDQRKKLLSFHQQLLKFHDSLPAWDDRIEKSDRDKTSEVTFAPEPLVQEMGQIAYSSNDELYNKMRKERIQREELRQKKKEMEDLMHKDKPKRHYSRNQDNQSDCVSYSTDFLGANASADITMATWGGSTADNLESINEGCDRHGDDGEENGDEDDDDNGNDCNDYNDDDDDYQSDDIIQIEEEECAESSSKETYTIEKDAQHHHVTREYQTSPMGGLSRSRNTFPNRNKCRYFGLENEARMDPRHNVYNRETLSERFSHKQPKQENIRAAEYIIQEDECDGSLHSSGSPLNTLERQMDRMTMTYQELLAEQQLLRQQLYMMRYQNGNSSTFETSQNPNLFWQPNLMMSPLEPQNPASQQQMLLALNQCFQHLSVQQNEMNNLQKQIHNLSFCVQSNKNVSPVNSSNQVSSTPGPNQWSSKSNQFSWDPNFQSSAHCTDTLTGSLLNPTSAQKSKKKGNNLLSASFSSSKSKKLTNPSPSVDFRQGKQSPKKCSKDCNQTCSYYWNFTGAEKCKAKSAPHVQYKRQPDSVRQKYSASSPEYALVENSKRKPRSFQESHSDIPKSRASNLSTQSYRRQSSKSSSDQRVKSSASAWLSKENITTSCQLLSESAKQEEEEEFINFDSLKSDIYAEVAKLISQNEKHPKYLICLFQKLQCLTSDCMRQHALQSLFDIIGDDEEKKENVSSMYSENPRSHTHPKTRSDDAKKIQTKVERSKQSLSVKGKKNSSFKEKGSKYEELADVSPSSARFANGPLKGTAINHEKVRHPLPAPQKIECKNVCNDMEYCNSCSSAMDQGSESSISDLQKVNGLTVNDQTKSIVNQLLPFVKVHKDQVFSAKLLTEMRQKIFFLLCQPGMDLNINCPKLDHVLETTLSEFECQSVHSSYQNVLMKVSEIIYNELAYVRLIKDLGEDSLSKKTLDKFGIIEAVDHDHPTDEEFSVAMAVPNAEHPVDEHLSLRNPSFEHYKRSNGIKSESKTSYEGVKNQQMLNGVSSSSDRDETHLNPSAMKIELAVSETKPFSRIGSDEDDEDEEETHTAEDPSITAVSLAVEKECCLSAERGDGDIHPQNKLSPSLDNEAMKPHTAPIHTSAINTATSPTVFNHQYPQGNGKSESASLQIGVEDLPNRLQALNNSELEESIHVAAFFDNLVNGTEVAGDGEALPANKLENSTNLDSAKDDIDQ